METLNCTKQQIVQALDRVITISVNPSQVVDELDNKVVVVTSLLCVCMCVCVCVCLCILTGGPN